MQFNISLNNLIINKKHNRIADSKNWVEITSTTEEFSQFILSGYAYCGSVFNNYALGRKRENFKSCEILSIDLDNSITYNKEKRKKTASEGYFSFEDAIHDPFIMQNALIAYTSCSHTDAWNHFRIVFLLPKAITDTGKYNQYILTLINRFGADPACKDVTRMFYGNTNADVQIFDKKLDSRSLKNLVGPTSKVSNNGSNYEVLYKPISPDEAREMLSFIPSKLSYEEWLSIVSAIANYFDKETALSLIEEWSPDKDLGTEYKIDHCLKGINIGTAIHFAKKYGYNRAIKGNNALGTTLAKSRMVSSPAYPDTSYSEIENSVPVFNENSNPDTNMTPKPGLTHSFEYTDDGNALRFISQYGQDIKYVHNSRKWYIWDRSFWKLDNKQKIVEMAKEVVRSINNEIKIVQSTEQMREAYSWYKKSQERTRIMNMIKLASSDERVASLEESFDTNPFYFNLKNGVYDLESNIFKPHDRDYHLTKIVNVLYDPNAKCPEWEKFINQCFDYDTELIEFVKRAVGYSMLGLIREAAFFYAYGTGANGKSIFFETLRMMFGDYYQKSNVDLILVKTNESIPVDVARLKGIRLSVLTEIPANKRINESRLKDLTGGDTQTARHLYQESFDFSAVMKLWAYGNHMLEIVGTDDGIWRRIYIIHFAHTIPENERLPRDKLLGQFEREKSGILNWMISGYKDYQEKQLSPPSSVINKTKEYREDQDIVGNFISEFCEVIPDYKISAPTLYGEFKNWCDNNGYNILSNQRFYKELDRKGFNKVKVGGNKDVIIGLNPVGLS